MSSLAAFSIPSTLHQFTPALSTGPLKSSGTKANASGTTGTTATSSGTNGSAASIGSTFLSLLAQELQNQDPTAPVDSTAMVGQMISLSQLGQLVSMNQILSAAGSTSTTGSTGATGKVVAQAAATSPNSAALTSAISGIANTLSPSTAGAATSQLPFDPNTMMPLNFGNASAAAASINSVLNTSTMGLSGANNNATGGK
jgi:flagellar basal-body rod modification protein FlgD